MKVFGTTIALQLLVIVNAQQNDWENQTITGINKERPHTSFFMAKDKYSHPNVVSLNGVWKFKWWPQPDQREKDFYKIGYDVTNWSDIVVPGNWQMQGFDLPVFVNIPYPFKRDAPYVMGEPPKNYYTYDHRNPVGSYVTNFDLPSNAKDQVVFLHFGGVESAMYIWVNGEKVGFSKSSYVPAEFDITKYLKPGKNKLAVEVYRFSDGSYLEDIDYWRLSGIFRDVELHLRPKTFVQDYFIKAEPSADFSKANLSVQLSFENRTAQASQSLIAEAKLSGFDKTGKPVSITSAGKLSSVKPFSVSSLTLQSIVKNPLLWSAESPHLYQVEITVKDVAGKLIETISTRIGIKKVEIKGELFYINGQLVKLKGVNRHEHHPRTGRHVDRRTIETDLRLIKQANINMIRTSHYPNEPYFYELCDEYGIYVMDETNNESHGYGIGNKQLGDDSTWEKAHVDRAVSMVQRDKNHACIILWSLGNEGGAGRNPRAMAAAVRKLDPSRPVYYDSDRSVSDIYDEGYLPPPALKALGEKIKDRPVFQREYLHAMGNSGGNMQDYWDVIYADSSIIGSAIWDWVDQGIAKKIDGSPLKYTSDPSELSLKDDEYFAYGGDFGNYFNDGVTSDGIVSSDRVPQPEYYEVQKVYQPVLFSLESKSPLTVRVHNYYHFTSLRTVDLLYELLVDGKIVGSGKLETRDILPGKSDTYSIPVPSVLPQGELIVNIYASLQKATPWADAGFPIAREQFVLKQSSFAKIKNTNSVPDVKETTTDIVITSGATQFIFNKTNGALQSWKQNDKELLKGVLEPYFWKPANDNQKHNRYNQELGVWRTAGETRVVKKAEVISQQGVVIIHFDMDLAVGANYQLQYTLNGEGKVQVEAKYQPLKDAIPFIPKFGMHLRIPRNYDNISWYGRGPYENYPDRKTGSLIGLYNLRLQHFMTDYMATQDNANRTDVRWFSFSSGNDGMIKVSGLQPLCFHAWDYKEEDIEEARHAFELPRRDFINLNIDLNIHGVGGNDSWGAKTMEQYTNPGNRSYAYGFIMEYDPS
jgi:beta-galactosidase